LYLKNRALNFKEHLSLNTGMFYITLKDVELKTM